MGTVGTVGAAERLAAAIAAVAVSLSIWGGMNRLADRYAREALEGPRTEAGGTRSVRADGASSGKSFRCSDERSRTG
jgi:hypothetical protein